MEQSLIEIWKTLSAQGYQSDKFSVHSYGEIYEELLAPYRHTAKRILEIGIFKGHSLLMWEAYFDGEVHGIDCSETPHDGMADLRPLIATGKHNIHIFDAGNEFDVHKAFRGMTFDVIIEDSSHEINHQLHLYNIFSKYLSDGGIYIVEDVQHLDETGSLFESMDSTKKITILDRRGIKKRYDDCLVIVKDK